MESGLLTWARSCIVDPNDSNGVQCCGIGLTCGSVCDEDSVAVNATSAVTTSGVVSTETVPECSPRKCPSTSQFYCPSYATFVTSNTTVTTTAGGGCCSNGDSCGADGDCVFTPAPSTTTSAEGSGNCAQGNTACPSSVGGGCCASTAACIQVTGKAYCSSTAVEPIATGVTAVSSESDSLSTGAKAGVAIGVTLGFGLIIGAATWWCLRRRKTQRSQVGASASGTSLGPAGAAVEAGDGSRSGPYVSMIGRMIGSGASGTGDGTRGVTSPPGRTVTETHSELASGVDPLPGMTQDNFGPDPARGLYTSEDDPREFSPADESARLP